VDSKFGAGELTSYANVLLASAPPPCERLCFIAKYPPSLSWCMFTSLCLQLLFLSEATLRCAYFHVSLQVPLRRALMRVLKTRMSNPNQKKPGRPRRCRVGLLMQRERAGYHYAHTLLHTCSHSLTRTHTCIHTCMHTHAHRHPPRKKRKRSQRRVDRVTMHSPKMFLLESP